MNSSPFKVYGYRWVVLVGFMLAVMFNQLLWITFAPITGPAAAYYGVSDLSIGLLSMSFMIAYLFVALPASWVIDTFGFRSAVSIGAALTGIFGLMRGLVADNYTLVLIAQIGIALGQPFILNAVTKVAARWFPLSERATASGLGTLAIYVGILVSLVLTPLLTLQLGLPGMLRWSGAGALIAALAFIAVARERPATPSGPPEQEERALMLDGLRQILRKREFQLLLLIFFVGLGVFNSVTTWIEDILRPRGFSITEAGLAGVTFASTLALLYLAAFVFGFFLLSSGPIGFQYGVEIGRPTPEGTSNGLLLLMGQISGIAFIIGMDSFKLPATGSMTPSLVALLVLMGLALLAATRLRESPLLSQ
ncbi:MAG TPA: MFS transporter [Anaerolineales bacterium]